MAALSAAGDAAGAAGGSIGEFELIRRYFDRDRPQRLPLGIGDDCALLPPLDCLAISTDMLVAGTHFFDDVDPASLGHKSLAVSLSDLAAMGAAPVAFTLAMALPNVDEVWLQAFASGLFAIADAHGCELVGGDTTRGPLNLCVTVFGEVPREQALRRDRARAGEDLWVSGELGGAAWAVARRIESERRGDRADRISGVGDVHQDARERLDRPVPRVALGVALRDIAHAAIDLSDGLLGDLEHVLARSAAAAAVPLGATVAWPSVPVHAALSGLPETRRSGLAMAGGDDYELLFTAPASRRDQIERLAGQAGLKLSRIGSIDDQPGVRVIAADGRLLTIDARPFDHFR